MDSAVLGEYAFNDYGSAVTVLRQYLPQVSKLCEADQEKLWGMWVSGIEEGMEDVLLTVAAQALLNDRSTSLDKIASNLSSAIDRDLLQGECVVLWRIYLSVLQQVIWAARQQVREALRSTPHPDSSLPEGAEKSEMDVASFLLEQAGSVQGASVKRIIITFLHQLFLENAQLIHRLHRRTYAVSLIPWMLEYAPSTHILLDAMPAAVSDLVSFDSFVLHLAAYLSLKYPLPRTLELCTKIIEKVQQFEQVQASQATEGLEIVLITLRAFPSLMTTVAPLLVSWQGRFGGDGGFAAATVRAATSIGEINAAVQHPIYRKTQCLISSDPRTG